jgi:RNA binding exosome subunit
MGNVILEIVRKIVYKTEEEKLIKNQIKSFFDFSFHDIDGKLVKKELKLNFSCFS